MEQFPASENGKFKIPVIDLSPEIERGSEKWQKLCNSVRDACETYGCFEVVYDKVTKNLREEVISHMREIFELPSETKKKNDNPKPYHGYYKGTVYESFGIEDVSNLDSLKRFTHLMWPQGHQHFTETISSVMKEVGQLHHKIGMLILDGYGLGGNSTTVESKTLLRLMRYRAPANGEATRGLHGHTDKPLCVLLWDNHMPGLQVQTLDGQWVNATPSDNSFMFIVGDPLSAWSNGRFKAAAHRVMVSGSDYRFSLGAFLDPVEGTIVRPPMELVDDDHPRIFNDFDYIEYARFSVAPEAIALEPGGQLMRFAGAYVNGTCDGL